MKRRDFLKVGTAGVAGALGGAGALLTWTPRANAATVSKTFYITDGMITQPDGVDVYFRGFSDSATGLNVPGAPLIVQENDTVVITVHNTLSTSHSFVIDGMVNQTIAAGQSKTFQFTAINPGTHFYYDSQYKGKTAPYNRLVGLHGAFAVMPFGKSNQLYSGSPTFVQQYFWLFHDFDPSWNSTIQAGGTPSGTYTPRYFTINGLSSRPPGAPDEFDPTINAMIAPNIALYGSIGDRTLIRIINAGKADQSVHTHGNHMEWLTQNGKQRSDIWLKDCLYLDRDMGQLDVIYPFENPPDAYPTASRGVYPMHLHSEPSQTAGGGLYMFGALTDIYFQ
jgi:FtsP/CotA-like multicopper oxidase with cupredoxin domain